jgi:hypothetical protein
MSTSIIRKFYDKATLRHHMGETHEIVKEGGISAATGAILGMIASKSHTGLDRKGIPLDAVGGVAIMAGSIFTPFLAQHREAVRQVGASALSVAAFRAAERFVHTGKLLAHGDHGFAGRFIPTMGEDPIAAAARGL